MITKEKESILVVEDEDIMRDSLVDWFSSEGHTVDAAEDGETALEKVAARDYKAMILDLKMPGIDGLTVLREVRVKQPEVKIVIVTAYPTVETAVEAMRVGAVDYLSKPFEMERLSRSLFEGPAVATPEAPVAPPIEKEIATPCIWMQAGIVKKRACTINYQCTDGCKFHAGMMKREERWQDNQRLQELLEQVNSLRGKYQCRYTSSGNIAFRICSNLYQCETCEFAQMMEDRAVQ